MNSHNSFNEERFLRNNKSNRDVDDVSVMVASVRLTLQDLLDPIKQEKRFKEEVKRKAFLEKDYKFVGKLTKNDWNVKLFNGDKDEDNKSDKVVDKLTPRPKERIAIFKEKLNNIENILTNGRSKTDDEVNRLTKKQLQKFETRSGNRCGAWIEKLKSELSDKQQSNTHKKFTANKPFAKKKSVDEDHHQSVGSSYQIRNPKVEYIKYEKLNKPIITVKQNETKFNSLDRLRLNKFDKFDSFNRIESSKITYARDNCSRCHGKVLTVDKLNINGALFHRNCLKCINCGSNLRLSELRQTNNVIDEKNCICTLCSNENRLTRSNSTSNYSSRLKERMKWKESFLLNLDSQEQKNQINERVEYENASNELLDDEEVTKLLNLDSKDVCSKSSQSSDMYSNPNNLSSDEEDETTETTSSTDTSDTTGADINSDQFDLSELESPKREKNPQCLPEIIVNKDEDGRNLNNSGSDDEQTLNETLNNHNTSINQTTTSNTASTTTNTLNDNRNFCVNIPEKSKTISDISEVELSEADDLNDHRISGNAQPPSSFKVEIPKLFTSNQQERYSKIPVLKDRILNEASTRSNDKRPTYNGSFTEKVLKSRSSPSLNDNSLLSFTTYLNTSSKK